MRVNTGLLFVKNLHADPILGSVRTLMKLEPMCPVRTCFSEMKACLTKGWRKSSFEAGILVLERSGGCIALVFMRFPGGGEWVDL